MGRTLVINRNSIAVSLESDHLAIRDHADAAAAVSRVPLVDIDRVVIAGQPAVSFPVFARLMDKGIPCSFLTRSGRWRGLMDGDAGFHAARRRRQYESLAEHGFALRFAASVIEAKFRNCRRTLQRLAANREESLEDVADFAALDACISALPHIRTIDAMRGMEGTAAVCYFRVLAHYFPPSARFECRTRRPPQNEANALMSFVYAMLTNEFVAAVRSHGLDVAAGYFHRQTDRSPALALDLMEPCRPALADRLVLDLLNHARIRAAEHFERRDQGVYLTEAGRRIVFGAFEEAMARRQNSDAGRFAIRQYIDKDVCSFIAMLEQGAEPQFYRAA